MSSLGYNEATTAGHIDGVFQLTVEIRQSTDNFSK